jgi:Zn-dependent peptidase ImmA (M78 family)
LKSWADEYPARIEQRANAFAAEFLLPRAEAGRFVKARLEYVYSPDERKKEIESMVSRLAKDYDVSHETAAWQMLQSGQIGECDEPVLNSFLKSIYKPYK